MYNTVKIYINDNRLIEIKLNTEDLKVFITKVTKGF